MGGCEKVSGFDFAIHFYKSKPSRNRQDFRGLEGPKVSRFRPERSGIHYIHAHTHTRTHTGECLEVGNSRNRSKLETSRNRHGGCR
jgi:hypothetical protein